MIDGGRGTQRLTSDDLKGLWLSQFDGYDPSLLLGHRPWIPKSASGFPVVG